MYDVPKNCWLEFIGEGRSGHTVIAAILDAHPQVRISEEFKQISKWYRGELKGRDAIFKMAHDSGMGKERKNYAIKDSHQLKYEDPLLVLGDKCGWAAVTEVQKREAPVTIYKEFAEHIQVPIKIIHAVRNPFDNIASWYISPKYKRLWGDDRFRFKKLIRRYRRFYNTASQIIETLSDENVFTLYNEDVISDPVKGIAALFDFLEVPYKAAQVEKYSEVILSKPTRKSEQMEWPKNFHRQIVDIIDSHDFLKGDTVSKLFEHYVFSRINCEYPVDPHYPQKLYDKLSERRFDEKWLSERCDFLEKYAIPAIKSQEVSDFWWIILAHTGTSVEIRKRLESYGGSTTKILYTDKSPREFLPDYFKRMVSSPWVISTTVDSDDAISVDFIKNLQINFRAKKEYLNYLRGYTYSPETGKFYGRKSERNPFITLVESTEDAKGVYCRVHGAAHLEAPITQIDSSLGYWIQVVHGDNLLNKRRMKTKDKGRSYNDIKARFKINV